MHSNLCTGLTSITIPNSVINIGNYSFSGCTGLTNITIFRQRDQYWEFCVLFAAPGLTSITIPNSVTNIGDCAFSACTGGDMLNN